MKQKFAKAIISERVASADCIRSHYLAIILKAMNKVIFINPDKNIE